MAIRIPFELRDDDGVLQAGIDLSAAGVVQISQNGAAFANRVGAAPTSIGGGAYYYALDATEENAPWVLLKVVKTGYQTVLQREDVSIIDIADALTRLLGVHRINSVLDGGDGFASVQYNVNQLATTMRLRVFDSDVNAAAATPGSADDADGEVARYVITGTDAGGGLLANMLMVQDL